MSRLTDATVRRGMKVAYAGKGPYPKDWPGTVEQTSDREHVVPAGNILVRWDKPTPPNPYPTLATWQLPTEFEEVE